MSLVPLVFDQFRNSLKENNLEVSCYNVGYQKGELFTRIYPKLPQIGHKNGKNL